MSAARVSLSSPSSAMEAASALPAEGLPRCSAKFRLPVTSLVGLSSRAALSSAGKVSSGREAPRQDASCWGESQCGDGELDRGFECAAPGGGDCDRRGYG